jgi:exonuclease SbcC
LAGSEVFLITGKTGAGKSTILDAICLALFADTPRLENTQMQEKTISATISDYYSLLYVMLGQDSLAHFCMGGKTLPEIRLRLFPGGGR